MIEVLKNTANEMALVIKNVNYTYVNALRRLANEIPVLAVDTLEISKNDSVLYDEMLAHRIGLIPLKADKNYTLPEECSCKGKGCAKCTASLTLKAVGPGLIKSESLKSKVVEPVFSDIPIVLLQKDQELEIVAEARLGRGTEHAKYSPGLVWFRAYPQIEIGKDCESCKECAKNCPKGVFDENSPKLTIKHLLNCDLCNSCTESCLQKGKNGIKVKGSESDFIVEIESWGQIPPKEIFTESLEALRKNLKDFDKELGKL